MPMLKLSLKSIRLAFPPKLSATHMHDALAKRKTTTAHARSAMRAVGIARLLGGHDRLVRLADLERADGLEEAGAVVRAGRLLVGRHLLGELAVELGARVAQLRLDVDELLDVLDLAVHLDDRHRVAVPVVLVRGDLDAR